MVLAPTAGSRARARPGSASRGRTGPADRLSVALPPAPPEPPAAEPAEPRTPAVSDSAIRVDVGLLDKLMTLVGELVLARNQIMQFSTRRKTPPSSAPCSG